MLEVKLNIAVNAYCLCPEKIKHTVYLKYKIDSHIGNACKCRSFVTTKNTQIVVHAVKILVCNIHVLEI